MKRKGGINHCELIFFAEKRTKEPGAHDVVDVALASP